MRRVIKRRKVASISKTADIAVFLSLILALRRLAKAASSKAQESRETVLTERHLKIVMRNTLASLKG